MKKIILPILLFCTSFLYAYETNYPFIMNNGTVLVNTGIGFGKIYGKMQCPTLSASFDYALPIAGLPWTIGIIAGYFSEVTKHDHYNYLPIAGRIAYHFNFKAPRLDSYILLTLGAAVQFRNSGYKETVFWPGLGIGVRYFFHPNVGAYTELAIEKVQIITFGLSFKI